ncbi:hypothetical protein [Halobellus limi]|uniref:Uncharacterized protein n=1 Tax=Halobellus limi TaxID=699433 RepID=A0A1H5TTC5_9EURY|nr:hypothetical protein [Halobellus limi]QCC47235.1 hypothetical protein DV707_05875 [Halobellus limi]SEF66085.1 hypothetical protein SAMN04488133_0374 [Halobellus limi]
MKRPRLRTVVLLALVAALLLAAGSALASSEYTVESTSSIDTPSRTVTVLGEDYTVSSLGYRDVGETVPVEVTRPGDEGFTVSMYNGDGLTMDSVEGSENGTYTLDQTTSLERGTYVLSLEVGDDREAIQPIVMSGYDFAVDAPEEVPEDERVSITVELTDDTERPNYVDVVVMNDSTHRYDAVRVDDRTYNVVIEDLDPDEYRFYAAARGEEEINGRDEATGVSAVQRLNITAEEEEQTTTEAPSTSTTTESSGGGGAQPGGSAGTATSTPATETPTNTTATPENVTATPTNATVTDVSTPASPGTDVDTSTDSSAGESGGSTATDSDVIEPSTPTDSDSQAQGTGTSTPMFPLNVVGAFLALMLLVRRRY